MSDVARYRLSFDQRKSGLSRIAEGFRIQGRVVHALLMREMLTRFGQNRLGALWLFIEPLMLAGAIATIHWVADRGAHYPGVSVFVFFLMSYTPFFAFRTIVSRAAGSLSANMTLLYHRPVRLLDVVFARHLLEVAVIIGVLSIIVICVSIWTERLPPSIPWLIGGTLLMMLYAHGLGMLVAAGAARSEAVERLVHPLTYLTMPLSGAFFAMHSMPPSIRNLLLWNPQVHFHEMVREGMFGDVLPSYFDLGYALSAVALANLLGMAALRAVRPRLEF